MPRRLDDGRAGVPIKQVRRAVGRLRSHLGESRDSDPIVRTTARDLLKLDHVATESARGLSWRRLQRPHAAVPNHDVVIVDNEIGRLDVLRHLEDVRIRIRLFGIELENAAVDLIEHKQVALPVSSERLRASEFHVHAGRNDTDHGSSRTAGKAAYDGIFGMRPHGEKSCANDEYPDPDPMKSTKHVHLNIPRTDCRVGPTNPRCR
ncbi:hypothetical protein MTX20_32315 [Bradyrhizobium sp. ISRA435]|nr:hypothetical protein MTX20_32315 [Bradyrhizobium sp. ISRA435]